jgi:hypothetical protein
MMFFYDIVTLDEDIVSKISLRPSFRDLFDKNLKKFYRKSKLPDTAVVMFSVDLIIIRFRYIIFPQSAIRWTVNSVEM